MTLGSAANPFDIVGIGFGPANVAVAIALAELQYKGKCRFLEARAEAAWHPGMLMAGTVLQQNFLQDLATLRNPQSEYTFLNFLKQKGRLLEFLNLDVVHPLRRDYSDYLCWAASAFDNSVDYSTRVAAVQLAPRRDAWIVETQGPPRFTRAIIVGSGHEPQIPATFNPHLGERVFHLTEYLERITNLAAPPADVAVVGSGQSAAEIHLDLLRRFPEARLHAVSGHFSFKHADRSPFSEAAYFPEFVDDFYNASASLRQTLLEDLASTMHKSCNPETLQELYAQIYEDRFHGTRRFHLYNVAHIDRVTSQAGRYCLRIQQELPRREIRLDADAVILATGFKRYGESRIGCALPGILQDVHGSFPRKADGSYSVSRDYRLMNDAGLDVYLNGQCEATHGLGAGNTFSLLSIRAGEIASSIASRAAARDVA